MRIFTFKPTGCHHLEVNKNKASLREITIANGTQNDILYEHQTQHLKQKSEWDLQN